MLLSRGKVCTTLWLMMGTFTLSIPQAYGQQDALEDATRKAAAISKTAKKKVPPKDQSGDRAEKNLNSLLTACPLNVRRDFLASMVIVAGHFASADLNAVQKCLNRDQYAALRDFFQISEDDRLGNDRFCSVAYGNCQPRSGKSCWPKWCNKLPAVVKDGVPIPQNSDTDASSLSIEDAVARCPSEIRNNYLDRLVFISGRLVKIPASPVCP